MSNNEDATLADLLAHAEHHRNAMVERRTIGLKVVTGVVTSDLLVLKLAVDSADHVGNHNQLAWAVRLILVVAFVVMAGMLVQLEIRNRDDRCIYRLAERRADAIQNGEDPKKVVGRTEGPWATTSRSWASSWPFAGVFFLTIALCWLAGLINR